MADTHEEEHDEEQPLSERLLDLFVFLPTGLAVAVIEQLPRLAERGRERLGIRVDNARAVGQFAVKAGHHELKKRSDGRKRSGDASPEGSPTPASGPSARGVPPRLRTIPYPPERVPTPPDPTAATATATATVAAPTAPATAPSPVVATPPVPPVSRADAHIPEVASLAIPGFDTLSASQVVQRLDGLSRGELVAVRAYETATRGRRTILSRVDQLLDERS